MTPWQKKIQEFLKASKTKETDFVLFKEQAETNEHLSKLTEILSGLSTAKGGSVKLDLGGVDVITLKGDKGDTGNMGPKPVLGVDYNLPKVVMPIAGVDYFTYQEQEAFKNAIKPIKGRDYDDGKDGYTPKKGIDYFDGEPGRTPVKGVDYFDGKTPVAGVDFPFPKDGKDGTEITPEEIVKKLESLKGNNRLDIKAIKGYFHAGDQIVGGGAGGARLFIQLSDVPNSYAGQANKSVTVRADETGLEFTTNVATDEKVKVSAADTTPDYLNPKITVGVGLSKAIVSPGGNETLNLVNTAPDQTVTFTGGVNVTIGGTYPNFVITDNSISQTEGDARYLKLDTSNDPLTGSLAWSTAVQGTGNSFMSLPTAAGTGSLQTYRLLMGGGGSSFLTVEGTDTIFQYNNFSSFGLGINRFKIDFGNTNALSSANEFVLVTKNFGLTVTDTLTISSQAAGWTVGSSSGLSFSNSSGSIQFSSASSVIFTGNANATINFGNLGTNVLNMEFKTALLGSGANLILVDGDKFTDTSSNNVGSFMLGVGGITPGNEGWAQIRTTYRAAANTSTAALHIAPAINNPSGSTVTYLASLNLEAPTLSNSGTAITNGVTLRVAAAPSVGTNLYALWVDAGVSRFDGNLNFATADATDIVLGTGTGTKIGTATTQKLAFFNATPIVQQANTVALDTLWVSFGFRASGGVANYATTLTPRAGTATAGTSPLKFTSGTNLTTAEAGAMEYNGTNLFFTRTGTTREGVLVGNRGAAAPTTTAGVTIVNFYGTSATNFLGTPNTWFSVVGDDGNVYKIAAYT